MDLTLNTKIQYLKGVGPKLAAKLSKLGIETTKDLIFYWPRAYQDFTNISPIGQIGLTGQIVTIRGQIVGIANKLTSRQRMKVTEAVVEDGTGTIKLVWFNQPFLKNMLKPGSEWIFRGKVDHNSFTNEWTMESPSRVKEHCIIPVYSTTAGLASGYISRLMSNVKCQMSKLKEFLPDEIITKYDLLPLQSAVAQIHMPQNFKQIETARKRLAFDELFMISLRSRLSREEMSHEQTPPIRIDEDKIKSFVAALPYELTGDQKKAAWQILQDMAGERTAPIHLGGERGADTSEVGCRPMNRLLNGDVGSGKTVVAAIVSYAVIQSGYQVAIMVPTEVLAAQHYKTFCSLFSSKNISIGLLTSSNKKTTGTQTKPQNANIIIGTHALLQKSVDLSNLGLIIVDEQHRFGVKQRAFLKEKTDGKIKPHFLSMTATPIPRTLHLALFGDLDVSVINKKPENRKEIKTRFVEPENRMKAYDFIRLHIKAGRQVFVICPLIEENEDSNNVIRAGDAPLRGSVPGTQSELFDADRKSVTKEYEKLSKEIFPEFRVAILHGKMKSKEKEAVLADFAANKTNILVSTSVIEVGIDVPNAAIMMIEDAERFGLAQLHQFRGRVGRAEHQSFCFLFSNSRSQNTLLRLKSLENVADGFKLAEIDLEMRGPGDMFGTLQSGQLELKMASFSDRMLIEQASRAAESIIMSGLLKYPELTEQLAEFESSKHFE